MTTKTANCPNGHADPIYVNDTLAECAVCGLRYDAETGEVEGAAKPKTSRHFAEGARVFHKTYGVGTIRAGRPEFDDGSTGTSATRVWPNGNRPAA